MFKPVRIVATLVFLAMIGLIFVGAFVIKIDVSSPCPCFTFSLAHSRFVHFTNQFLCLSEPLFYLHACAISDSPSYQYSSSSSISHTRGTHSHTSLTLEQLCSSFSECNHLRFGLDNFFIEYTPPSPPVFLVSSIGVCFELDSLWSLSVRIGVRYVPRESNYDLPPFVLGYEIKRQYVVTRYLVMGTPAVRCNQANIAEIDGE